MNSPPCAECLAIYRELQAAFAAAVCLSDQPTTLQEIATWIQRLDEEEYARMGENIEPLGGVASVARAPDAHRALLVAAAGGAWSCESELTHPHL